MTFKLLRDKLECLSQFLGKSRRSSKSHAIENDLRYENGIGDDHCNLTEEGFEIIWQRCSSEDIWVHCDEKPTFLLKLERSTLNHHFLSSFSLCLLDY